MGSSENTSNADEVKEEEVDEDDEPYIVPRDLELPIHTAFPLSMKHAAIIEKTAYFVARQGPQMEIVVKTKQANNPQFSFMSMDHKYNAYFKHVLKQIKMGRYHPQLHVLSHVSRSAEAKRIKENASNPSETEAPVKLPKINTSDTAYAKLINQFKKYNKPTTKDGKESPVSGTSTPVGAFEGASSETSSNVDAPAADVGNNSASDPNEQTSSNSYPVTSGSYEHGPDPNNHPQLPQGPVPNQRDDPEGYARYYEQWQAYYHWYYQYYQYADNGNENQQNPEASKSAPPYGKAPTPPSQHPSTAVQPQAPDVPPPGVDTSTERQRGKAKRSVKERVGATAAAAAAAAATVSASEPAAASQASCDPTDHWKPIIDRMAEYVARNGIDFEKMVRVKNDPRFIFLDASHPYHAYYQRKRRDAELAIAMSQAKKILEEKRRQLQDELASETEVTATGDQASSNSTIADVYSNSEVSSNNTENKAESNGDVSQDASRKSIPTASGSISFQLRKENVVQKPVALGDDEEDGSNSSEKAERSESSKGHESNESQVVKEEKEEGEISPTLDDGVEEVERRLANKLAAAARDKLARVNRENVMQAERKKRAAAFMAKIRAVEIGSSLTSRLEKRRIEEEEEKEKAASAAAAVASSMMSASKRPREKTPPAAYAPLLSGVPTVEGPPRSVIRPRVSPEVSSSRRPSHTHHKREREREREGRRRSRSRSRDRRERHRHGSHYRRHHERR